MSLKCIFDNKLEQPETFQMLATTSIKTRYTGTLSSPASAEPWDVQPYFYCSTREDKSSQPIKKTKKTKQNSILKKVSSVIE